MNQSLNKKQKIQRIIYSAILIVAIIISANLAIKYGKITDQQLIDKTKAYNKTLPLTLDEHTRLDSVKVAQSDVLNYYLTCIDIVKEEINTDSIVQYVYPILLNNAKSNPDIKALRNNRVTLKYLFYDKNGHFFHEYPITPKMYKK